MEDLAENFLYLAGAELGHGSIERPAATKRWMRSREEPPGVHAIAPDLLGIRNYSRDSLSPFAFGCAQPVEAALGRGFWDNPVHALLMFHLDRVCRKCSGRQHIGNIGSEPSRLVSLSLFAVPMTISRLSSRPFRNM
jgi:hypothetical protein